MLQIEAEEALLVSAKEGIGIDAIMEAIVDRVPPPVGDSSQPLQALLFDAWYDAYRGVVVLIKVKEGTLRVGDPVRMMAGGGRFEVEELGTFTPLPRKTEALSAGEVGFVIANIKRVADAKVGDTITHAKHPTPKPLPGYKEAKPMVFAGIYPITGDQYELLREALKKLRLNDASVTYEAETSSALGFGFRCGFLGLLHMEIVRERLQREYKVDILTTAPTVVYKVVTTGGETFSIDNPTKLKSIDNIDHLEEPFVLGTIIVPDAYLGTVMAMLRDRRGIQRKMEYLNPKTVLLEYELPFNEIVLDFYDRLKSSTKGYASFDYEFLDFRTSNLVKLDILLNGELVDALSLIAHRDKAYFQGRDLAKKLKDQIPRQMFEVAIQASIGGKVIARESVKALRKNVLAKCYGGDVTRKRKLLEKQKAGKKKMKLVGKVEVPQEAFLAVLRTDGK